MAIVNLTLKNFQKKIKKPFSLFEFNMNLQLLENLGFIKILKNDQKGIARIEIDDDSVDDWEDAFESEEEKNQYINDNFNDGDTDV